MNFPPTTPLSRLLMTSKRRFLCDGTGDVYVKCYFSQLSSTSSALLGPWKPYPGGIDHAFRPSLGPSRQNKYRPAATVQLLTKKRSIFLSLPTRIATIPRFLRSRRAVPLRSWPRRIHPVTPLRSCRWGRRIDTILLSLPCSSCL